MKNITLESTMKTTIQDTDNTFEGNSDLCGPKNPLTDYYYKRNWCPPRKMQNITKSSRFFSFSISRSLSSFYLSVSEDVRLDMYLREDPPPSSLNKGVYTNLLLKEAETGESWDKLPFPGN